MSRPTVALLAAKYEALDGAIQVLKDELVKANRRIVDLEDQIRNERKVSKPFTSKLNKRQAAAKELGKKLGRTFSREELDEYMASM